MFHIFYQACILHARGYTYADRVWRFQSWDGAKSKTKQRKIHRSRHIEDNLEGKSRSRVSNGVSFRSNHLKFYTARGVFLRNYDSPLRKWTRLANIQRRLSRPFSL